MGVGDGGFKHEGATGPAGAQPGPPSTHPSLRVPFPGNIIAADKALVNCAQLLGHSLPFSLPLSSSVSPFLSLSPATLIQSPLAESLHHRAPPAFPHVPGALFFFFCLTRGSNGCPRKALGSDLPPPPPSHHCHPPPPLPHLPEAFPLLSSTVCLRHRDQTGSAPRCHRLIKAGLKGRRQEGGGGGVLALPRGLVNRWRGPANCLALRQVEEEGKEGGGQSKGNRNSKCLQVFFYFGRWDRKRKTVSGLHNINNLNIFFFYNIF